MLEVAAEEARAAVNAASLSVSRWERGGGALRTIINVGDLGTGEERYPAAEVYTLGEDRGADRLLNDGVAYFNAFDDADVDPWCAARLRRLGKESEVGVPVLVEGEAWGEVYATTAPGQPRFRGEDVRFLEAVAGQLAVAIGRAELFSRVSRLAYEQLERAYLGTAEALTAALEAKDSYTAEHSRSIVQRAEAVGRRLGMPESEVRAVRYAAAFHDIGKLAVPETILNKPGPLTSAERVVVERHTVIGEQILSPVEFLSDVLPLVRSAHERFDGSGYPDGLAGEQIPLGARIVFACDTYDAMTTDRSYRAAPAPEQAKAELRRVAGGQLDPTVVEALIEILP